MVKNNYFNKFRRKGKGKAKVKKVQRPPRMTFVQKVQKIIASNIENKYTNTIQTTLPVLTISKYTGTPANYTHLTWSPGSINVGLWDISQGSAVNERTGNNIKIKRWILKGIIQPHSAFVGVATANNAFAPMGNTFTGYVDVYFGRLLNNLSPPPSTLENFYQNGAVDITPISENKEMLYRVNKDLYKVYFHKRFKMSTGNVGTTTTNLNFPQSNDFNMTRTFGFDITKYILKNKMLKYDEIVSFPQSGDVQNLTLWAIFHPATGDPTLPSGIEQKSFYDINLMSYGEYEDA